VLQEIGDAESRIERVSSVRSQSEVVREDPQPDQADDTARQNAGGHQECETPSALARPLAQAIIPTTRRSAGSYKQRRTARIGSRASKDRRAAWSSNRCPGRNRWWPQYPQAARSDRRSSR